MSNMTLLWGRLKLLLGRYPWGLKYSFEIMKSRAIRLFKDGGNIKRMIPAGHIRGFMLWALEDLLDYHDFKIPYYTRFNVSALKYYLPLVPLTYFSKNLRGIF